MLRLLLAAATLVTSVPAAANHFSASTAGASAPAKFVLKDVVWTCEGEDCSGGRSASRPAVVCAALARKVGALTRFSVDGQPLPAEALEKCNVRAKRGL